MNTLLRNILNDIRVELTDEFDKNFARRAFFKKRWPERRFPNRGTLMVATGRLRRSIRSRVTADSVVFTSSEPYAAIHNDGGTIRVTAKMKRFFWARYKQTKNEMYKGLALKKVGSEITIPQRQFIGDSPEVKAAVERIAKRNVHEYVSQMLQKRR